MNLFKILDSKRCNLGEGPIWNEKEQKLYYTNGYGADELCIYDFATDKIAVRKLPFGVAAYAFDRQNRLLISHAEGVHILNDDTLTPIYDNSLYKIEFANDTDNVTIYDWLIETAIKFKTVFERYI